MAKTLLALLNTLADRCKQTTTGWIRETEDLAKTHLGDLLGLALISARNDPIEAGEKDDILKLTDTLLRGKDSWSWRLSGIPVEGLYGMCPREALDVALLERGLDPQILPLEPDTSPWEGSAHIRWSMRMDWAIENQYLGLARRLLWHPDAAAWYAKKSIFKSTGTSAPGSLADSAEGWAWIVRNGGDEILALMISHGAPANYADALGRPVLAYAKSNNAIGILLDNGADPLDYTLPYGTRRSALRAMFVGWQWQLIRGELPKASSYLKNSLSQWPEDERNPAVAELLLRLDNLLAGTPMGGQPSTPLRDELAQMVGLGKTEKPHYLDENGKAWAWQDRQAWALMASQPEPKEEFATVKKQVDEHIIPGIDNALWSMLALVCQRREEDRQTISDFIDRYDCDQLALMVERAIDHCLTHPPHPKRQGAPILALLGSLMGGWQQPSDQWIAQGIPVHHDCLARQSLLAIGQFWQQNGDRHDAKLAPIAYWWSVSGRERALEDRALAACLMLGWSTTLPGKVDQVFGRWLDEATKQKWSAPIHFPGMDQALQALALVDPLRAAQIEASGLDRHTQSSSSDNAKVRL